MVARRRWRNPGFFLAAFALLAGGCEPPVICGHPLAAISGENVILAASIAAPGQEESAYFLFTASVAELGRWRRQGPFSGKPVGLATTATGVELILENGVILSLEPQGAQRAVRHPPQQSPVTLASAAWINGQWYAASAVGQGEIILWRLVNNEWSAAAPPLAIVGLPRQLRLSAWRERPLLIWRSDIGGQISHDLDLALWDNGDWHYLPPPAGRGHFATFVCEDTLWLVRDKMAPPPSAAVFQYLADGCWRSAFAIAMPAAGIFSRGTGAAVALPEAGGILFFHADTAGLRVLRADALPASHWSAEVEIWQHGPAASLTLLLFAAVVVSAAALLLLIRQAQRKLRLKSRRLTARAICGLASPLDRSLAFAVDALLLLPLPLAFRWAASDITPFALIPSQHHLSLYWLWMAGISLYLCVAEYTAGSSVGKMIFGLRVRNASGGRPLFRQILLRNLGRIVDFWPLTLWGVHMPYLVGLLFIAFTPRRQRLGDLLAKTAVRYHLPINQRDVVLASGSPRRRILLERLGLRFRIELPEISEDIAGAEDGETAAIALARQKAEAVGRRLAGGELIIAADTIVALDSRLIGKPRDRQEARDILALLSGRTHHVITGVVIIDRATGQCLERAAVSEVEMRPLSEAEIAAYVVSGESDGKAGAYAVQETGDRFIRQIRGSVTNVIGLPLEMLTDMLAEIEEGTESEDARHSPEQS